MVARLSFRCFGYVTCVVIVLSTVQYHIVHVGTWCETQKGTKQDQRVMAMGMRAVRHWRRGYVPRFSTVRDWRWERLPPVFPPRQDHALMVEKKQGGGQSVLIIGGSCTSWDTWRLSPGSASVVGPLKFPTTGVLEPRAGFGSAVLSCKGVSPHLVVVHGSVRPLSAPSLPTHLPYHHHHHCTATPPAFHSL